MRTETKTDTCAGCGREARPEALCHDTLPLCASCISIQDYGNVPPLLCAVCGGSPGTIAGERDHTPVMVCAECWAYNAGPDEVQP